jgi:hypothetical protein
VGLNWRSSALFDDSPGKREDSNAGLAVFVAPIELLGRTRMSRMSRMDERLSWSSPPALVCRSAAQHILPFNFRFKNGGIRRPSSFCTARCENAPVRAH